MPCPCATIVAPLDSVRIGRVHQHDARDHEAPDREIAVAAVDGDLPRLLERGYKIPQQISVVGFDDIPYARYIYPKLTTVRYPIEEMGERAAELALRLLEKRYSVGTKVAEL